MKYESKYDHSRRNFLRLTLTGTGTAIALRSAPSPGLTSEIGNELHPARTIPGLPESVRQSAIKRAHETISLDGIWSVIALPLQSEGHSGYREFAGSEGGRMVARVPGDIHLDLMNAGRMPDPTVADNVRTKCRWPEQHSWWYQRKFVVTPDLGQLLYQRLILEGVDFYGQIFLNGQLVGTTTDAFEGHVFDVKGRMREGDNELVIRVTSGMELNRPLDDAKWVKEGSNLGLAVAGTHLRKFPGAFSESGLPNIGISRSVRLEFKERLHLSHVRLDTVIRGGNVFLEGDVTLENLHPYSGLSGVITLELKPAQGQTQDSYLTFDAPAGISKIPVQIAVQNAQLWWPNELGDQPLYQFTVCAFSDGKELDRTCQTIGLRTLELDRSAVPEGSRFCFKVNGERVFCKGANWMPADLIAARADATRYQALIDQAKNAHFTMLRVNGDVYYERDEFYDACDRAGILVWQEFPFSDSQYPDNDAEFMRVVRAEAESAVRRLRHHPSIALWCGNNEISMCMVDIWKSDPTKPEDIGGVRIFNEVLPSICRDLDPIRPYWPSSPSGDGEPNTQLSGDSHGYQSAEENAALGDIMRGEMAAAGKVYQPAEDWRLSFEPGWRNAIDTTRARFLSESYSYMSLCDMRTIEDDRRPDTSKWQIPTDSDNSRFVTLGIKYHYGAPDRLSLKQLVLYTQMYQAIHVGGEMEALRFRKGDALDDCEGNLLWSFNDNMGGFSWSIIDHRLRRKAAYYWFRRSAAPVKVLVRSRQGHLVTRIVNDTNKRYEASVNYGWMRVDGSAQEMKTRHLLINKNGMTEVDRAPIPLAADRNPREWLYGATLHGDDLEASDSIWLLAPFQELALRKPAIESQIEGNYLVVRSPYYCHGVHIDDGGREALSDDYFDLLPGVPRRIAVGKYGHRSIYSFSGITPIDNQAR